MVLFVFTFPLTEHIGVHEGSGMSRPILMQEKAEEEGSSPTI